MNRIRRLCWSCFGSTAVELEQVEPFEAQYVARLTLLLISRRMRFHKWVWALRARPAAVCGVGGSYIVADWAIEANDAGMSE